VTQLLIASRSGRGQQGAVYRLGLAASRPLIPRVVMGLLPVLVNFDRAQLQVAESLSATSAQALRQVLLPQVCAAAAALSGRGSGLRRLRRRWRWSARLNICLQL
jgi:ABC-type spermidine/putrescine transport system permease subunit II